MTFYDLTHAYQPFEPPNFIPDWVEENLRNIFIPISRAMKEGVIKRHVQLQGWTIDAFLKSPEPIEGLAMEFLENLREARKRGHIRLGFSGYSHPILPFLSEEVFVRSTKEDYTVVKKYLGEPTWFWFPEGACDQQSLEILFREFPKICAAVPDGCIGRENFNGFFELEEGGRVAVYNTVLKDIFLNAFIYKEPQQFSPKGLSWKDAERMIVDGEALLRALPHFTKDDFAILVRDLEQYSRKRGLIEFRKGFKEQNALYESRYGLDFAFIDNADFTGSLSLEEIRPSSWEPLATERKPYPYWGLPVWVEFINSFCEVYNNDFPKSYLAVLASDVPWHLLAPKEWGTYPPHSCEFTRKVILPIVEKIGSAKLTSAAQKLLQELKNTRA